MTSSNNREKSAPIENNQVKDGFQATFYHNSIQLTRNEYDEKPKATEISTCLLPKANEYPLKNAGWKMFLSFLKWSLFR